MNTLSWLLYLADVADNLDWFFFLVMLIAIIGTVIWIAAALAASEDKNLPDDFWPSWKKVGLWLLLPAFVLGVVLGSVIPSKDTVYAIAASEMGERALNTPTATKAFRALDRWLERQMSGEEPEVEATKDQAAD